jgi:hypothetical protein
MLFNDLVERPSEDQAWRSSFFQQSSRPRFMYAPETRKRLLKNLEQYDKTCSKPASRPSQDGTDRKARSRQTNSDPAHR